MTSPRFVSTPPRIPIASRARTARWALTSSTPRETSSADFASDVRVIFEKSATGARSFVSDTSEHAPVRVTHDATSGAHGVAYNLLVADAYVVRVFFRDRELFDAARRRRPSPVPPRRRRPSPRASGFNAPSSEKRHRSSCTSRTGTGTYSPPRNRVSSSRRRVVVVDGATTRTCESGKVTALDASAVALAWTRWRGGTRAAHARDRGTRERASVHVRRIRRDGRGGGFAVCGARGAWRDERAACDVHGAGLRGAIVGVGGTVRITARDANGNARLTGGDAVHARVVDTAGVAAAPADDGDGYRRRDVRRRIRPRDGVRRVRTHDAHRRRTRGGITVRGSRGGRRGGGVAREHPRVRGGLRVAVAGEESSFVVDAADADGVGVGRRRRARRHAHAHVRFRNRAHHDARLRGRHHPGHERRGGRGRRDVHRQARRRRRASTRRGWKPPRASPSRDRGPRS